MSACNINGCSDFSAANTLGSTIQIEPGQVTTMAEGPLTTEFYIHVVWDHLDEEEMHGDFVLSYNL